MGQYQYTAQAVDDGQVLTSTCYADDDGQVRSDLKRIGYTVDSVKPQKAKEISLYLKN